MFLLRFICAVILSFCCVLSSWAAPVKTYLPAEQGYNSDITTPESVLGFDLGEQHPRHDQLSRYFQVLAQQSPRVMLEVMGQTPQHRSQQLITISAAENLANLEHILAKRHTPLTPLVKEPLVIWLGYSVHGDEASGASAAMAVAYYLAASKAETIKSLLADTIIVLEPSLNPDGLDRFVNWVTTYGGTTTNTDANHMEHHQYWPTGRTNHFWFDLNRDWLLLTQAESQHRLPYFHRYQPHVLGDFHEMGANSSYFFQPGIASRTHALTPLRNTQLTRLLAKVHAKALDQAQELYYSGEDFDDFYYGKGSTYPDINGGVGILFEQASSRGKAQDTINGVLTFADTIKNQVITSLSTIEGAWQNKAALKKYRQNFYQQALTLASKEAFDGYLLRAGADQYRFKMFLHNLSQHGIKVYPLASDFRYKEQDYTAATSYYLPLEQPQYRMIQAIFSQSTQFKDNTFYDVSGWTLPLAMNIDFQQVTRTWGLKISSKTWQMPAAVQSSFTPNAYAYVFEWQDFMAPKLLQQLLSVGIQARVATKSFIQKIAGVKRVFKPGSILIAASWQQPAHWRKKLAEISRDQQVPVIALSSGLNLAGVDLGSNSFKVLNPVNVLLLGGTGVSQYEAGEIRYYLDNLLSIPVSVVEKPRLAQLDLSSYSHIILVDGHYHDLPAIAVQKVTTWLEQGGVIYAQKQATYWLAEQDLLKANFISKHQLGLLFDTDNLRYQDQAKLAARQRIAGAIFASQLDITHPLAYGYDSKDLPLFRNDTLIMKRPEQPFISVAHYTEQPLMSGYTDQNLVNSLAGSAAIIAHNVGQGRIIASSHNLMFRGYWLGSAKLLANSLFFAKSFDSKMVP